MRNGRPLRLAFLIPLLALRIVPASPASLYWEEPSALSPAASVSLFPKSVYSEKSPSAAVFWEEADQSSRTVYLSLSVTQDGAAWRTERRFAGPFAYSGDVPDLYSAVMGDDGTIVLATVGIDSRIEVSASSDGGRTFLPARTFEYNNQLLAPRLYVASDGSFWLFATMSRDENFSIMFSKSRDGKTWEPLLPFSPSSSFPNAMVPYLAPVDGGDMVVYQSHLAEGNRNTFQLYATVSSDGGRSWSEPVLVSGEDSLPRSDPAGFGAYNNQSPCILSFGKTTYLAWERSRYGSTASSVWVMELSSGGHPSSQAERISSQGNASRPVLFSYGGSVWLLWFDTRSGTSQVYCNRKDTVNWDTEDEVRLSSGGHAASFAVPVVSANGGSLSFAWQEQTAASASRISVLVSDASCREPVVRPVNFKAGGTYASESARVSVSLSSDSSGIAGFSYVWTQDEAEEPPKVIQHMPHEAGSAVTVRADAEGVWYFKARQCDNAGNWSGTASVSYCYDATPPGIPLVTAPEPDALGFVPTSDFSVSWRPSPGDDDIAGYTWSLSYVAAVPGELASNRHHRIALSDGEALSMVDALLSQYADAVGKTALPPQRLMGTATRASWSNRRNGLYVFSVSAVDAVGHVGPPARTVLLVNKYNPSTYITAVRGSQDEDGTVTLSISGGGFTYDGYITEVYLDRDGKPPYDVTLLGSSRAFSVDSDSAVSGIRIEDMEAGEYRVGLLHPVRGTYFAPAGKGTVLSVEESGTVKMHSQYAYAPKWTALGNLFRYHINAAVSVMVLSLLFALVGFIAAAGGLASAAKDAVLVRAEVEAIVKGGAMPQEKKALRLKQRTASLRTKLIGYSAALVVTIVALITFPLALYMTGQQKQTLYEGLRSRVNVLLDALVSEARTNLPPAPAEDRDKLDDLPAQMDALSSRSEASAAVSFVGNARRWLLERTGLSSAEGASGEAVYVTITGFDEDMSGISYDYVWATNDAELNPPLSNASDLSLFVPGTDRLYDFKSGDEKEYVSLILEACDALGREVAEEASVLESMYGAESGTPNAKRLRDELDALLASRASQSVGSFPSYNLQDMDESVDEFLFYEPVLDTPSSAQGDTSYVRGIVLVKVNVQSLKDAVRNSRLDILLITLAVIFVAVLIGFLGSLLLALIIIKPIKLLVSHVAMIRDTEDKELLSGKDIAVTSRDEIGILGETVNEMTHGLVQAAIASKNLIVGKEVQTRFLPLQTDENGSQLATGSLSVPGADFFSYYAGADELSGDYFDYRRLDGNKYAVIKCDVSGHGVPAALIMVEVATLFLNYFSKWNPRQNVQTALSTIVGRMNDLLEQRGFKGRFAAFTLCVLDVDTGEAFFCNAGDNLVQVYDGALRKKKTVPLPETPAAGMFSTDLVEMKGGYPVSRYVLKKGDVLFLYTDGIEEAKRTFRTAGGDAVSCAEPSLAPGDEHGNHKVGESGEEMTGGRVTAIIESVCRGEPYELTKWHNPNAEEKFTFDFSTCGGSAEDAVLALVSVEKVFRMYKPSGAAQAGRVKVDCTIDRFLEKHFRQYLSYASSKSPVEGDPRSVWWNGVAEDPQYDDLTLIAIKKK